MKLLLGIIKDYYVPFLKRLQIVREQRKAARPAEAIRG